MGAKLIQEAISLIKENKDIRIAQDITKGRTYTQPTLRQERKLKKRFDSKARLETPGLLFIRTIKRVLMFFYLYCGFLQLKSFFLKLKKKSLITVILYHRVNDKMKNPKI